MSAENLKFVSRRGLTFEVRSPARPLGRTGFRPGRSAMARRFLTPYQSEPVSRLATWSRNLAIFAVVAVVVSILIVRFGFLEMKPALATFFGALGLRGAVDAGRPRRLCPVSGRTARAAWGGSCWRS